MNLNNIKKELEKFNRYKFYEDEHKYTYVEDDGSEKEIGISVTSLIDKYTNFFDEEKVAGLKSLKEGIPKEEILNKWHYDRDYSCIKGTFTHLYNEYLWKGKKYDYDKELVINTFDKDVIEPVWNKLKSISDSFYNKFKDNLIPIGLELVIGIKDFDIAGTIDFLAYSKKLDAIIIIDYKTNKEIRNNSFNNQKMLSPLDNVIDSNYYHYSLQLAIYKHILEHETNLKIYPKKWLVWMNENNDDFKLYECANLDEKAEEILKLRVK